MYLSISLSDRIAVIDVFIINLNSQNFLTCFYRYVSYLDGLFPFCMPTELKKVNNLSIYNNITYLPNIFL